MCGFGFVCEILPQNPFTSTNCCSADTMTSLCVCLLLRSILSAQRTRNNNQDSTHKYYEPLVGSGGSGASWPTTSTTRREFQFQARTLRESAKCLSMTIYRAITAAAARPRMLLPRVFPPPLGFMANLGRLGGIPRVGVSPREHAGMLNNGARNIYMSAGCTLSRAKLQCAVMMRNKIKNSHAGFGAGEANGRNT